jgi:hypothetical protein
LFNGKKIILYAFEAIKKNIFIAINVKKILPRSLIVHEKLSSVDAVEALARIVVLK